MGNVILGWVICSEGVWTWSISLGELLDTGVNFVAALVTAAALVAGFRQMKMTWENDSDARLQDRYFEFQQKAYLVDAYVTRHPKQKRFLVIANQTDGAIRNVKLHVKWPDLDGRPLECNQLDDFSLHCVPKKDLCWKVLPQGQWFVSPNSEITYATWTYPQLDGDGNVTLRNSLNTGMVRRKGGNSRSFSLNSRMHTVTNGSGCLMLPTIRIR